MTRFILWYLIRFACILALLLALLLELTHYAHAATLPADELPTMSAELQGDFIDILIEGAGHDCKYLTHARVQYTAAGPGWVITCMTGRDERAFDVLRTKRVGNLLTWTATPR